MSDVTEPANGADASTLYDAGLLKVNSFLYVLRDDAGTAADKLRTEINQARGELERAEAVLSRLDTLANRAEQYAELVHQIETGNR